MEEKRKILHDLVKDEARKIRMIAYPDELFNLDIDSLDSDNVTKCIYGQMTGCCFSERAEELIHKCCNKVYNTGPFGEDILRLAESCINIEDFNDRKFGMVRLSWYCSPIEKFIDVEKRCNIEELVKYLKGETEELNFI